MRVRQLGARLPVGGAGARRCSQAQRERKDDCEKDENAGQLEVVRLPCPVRISSTSSRKPQHRALIWLRHGATLA